MWFPRLASDRALRARPVEAPFALIVSRNNAERLACVNVAAESRGLWPGMNLADARAFCPDLVTRTGDPQGDRAFLVALRRWATRYCPWVGLDGTDGLVLDITGAAHLWGGEAAMLADMRARAARAGLTLRLGAGDTRGAAWALARHGEGIAPAGRPLAALAPLPVAWLRLDADMVMALQRLGLRRIGDLAGTARAPLARRFGPGLLMRLDQAMGEAAEPITPEADPVRYALRLNLPDPVGLLDDVMAAVGQLLGPLCDRLKAQETGARRLILTLRRVDQVSRQVELRLAAPMRETARILPLFERGIAEVDAGFGIDQIRLEATLVQPLPIQQIGSATATGSHDSQDGQDRLDDLMTRIGTRIGLENLLRFLPADSHIPERGFVAAAAAHSRAETGWSAPRPRPVILFPPEPVAASGARPPARFRWRRMIFATARATGPERIAPEWWLDDPAWRSGLRDYWRLETRQGRRLWLFHTPQDPGWFVQGEFA